MPNNSETLMPRGRIFIPRRTREDILHPVSLAVLAAALTTVRSTAQNAWERRHLDAALAEVHLDQLPENIEQLSAAPAALYAVCVAFHERPDKAALARAQALAKRIAKEIRRQQALETLISEIN